MYETYKIRSEKHAFNERRQRRSGDPQKTKFNPDHHVGHRGYCLGTGLVFHKIIVGLRRGGEPWSIGVL